MNRRHILLITALAVSGGFALPARSVAQSPNQGPLFTASREQLDCVKIVLAQQDAWNKGDLDGYLSHYKNSPDTQAVLATLVRGFDNIRNAYRQNFPNKDAMGTIEDSEVDVKELDDHFAIATGKYHLNRSKKGGGSVEGTFMEVFEKTPNGWQIVYSAST